jgi:uncharacterized OsmC-like protein
MRKLIAMAALLAALAGCTSVGGAVGQIAEDFNNQGPFIEGSR